MRVDITDLVSFIAVSILTLLALLKAFREYLKHLREMRELEIGGNSNKRFQERIEQLEKDNMEGKYRMEQQGKLLDAILDLFKKAKD